MKRLIIYALLLSLAILPAAAQSFAEFEQGFVTFSETIADSLPFNALTGQQWSDAFIGKFAHLGAGVTLGATTLPYETIKPVLDLFGIPLPEELAFLADYGIPLPAYSLDARLGLPALPLDVGIKFGTWPEEAMSILPENLSLDYLMLGVDLRYALLAETAILPAVSIGAGYNFLQGTLGMSELMGSNITITDMAGYNISLSDPEISFTWETSVIDLKAQVSKQLLFLVPFAGVGVSYGISNAGGGLESQVLLNGVPITEDEISQITGLMGENAPDLTNRGIITESTVDGWAVRAFGGVGIKLWILYIDLGAMYNLSNQAYGASVNLRIQL